MPIALLILIFGVCGICVFLATMQVFYRDIRFIVPFATSVLFFLTPIFYPIEFLPEKYRIFIELNPFYALIEPVRSTIYDVDIDKMLFSFSRGGICSLIFVLLGVLTWKKKKNELYYHI